MSKNPENLSEEFTEDCRQVLLGSLLGDGSLSCGNGKNYYMEEVHCLKQKEYLLWKNSYFRIFNGKTRFKTNKNYRSFALKTLSYPILTDYYKLFYPNRTKTVSEDILNQLKELGLTVWYLDDGHITTLEDMIRLATDGYSYKENNLIQKHFTEKWGLHPYVGKRNGKYYYILFNKRDSEKLLEIFKKVFRKYKIPESMFYKLGSFWKGNAKKIEDARKNKNEYKRSWRKKRSEISKKKKLKELALKGLKIRKLYWEKGMDSAKIGRIMGYSGGGIRKIMRKLDIPRRTPSEVHSGERNGFYRKHHGKESRIKISRNRWGKNR
ncbi:MAG: hypothetical protein WA139_05650 [Candidatus Aenigmatarchaeota archaeon]